MTHYFKSIAQLKRKEMSNRSIAVSLNLARNTVNKAVKLMEASELSYIEIESLDDGKLHAVFNISTGPKRLESIVVLQILVLVTTYVTNTFF